MLWETGDEIFPSLGAEFIQDLGSRFELEAYSFGYLRVEKQSAWAVGLRGSRRLAFSDHVSISPFFGPAYGRVRALDESIETPVSIGHLMLLGFERRISEFEEKILFATHTLEIVEELTLDFPLGPRADVANGLDQQIDQVVCQAATAQIGKGCQPSELHRLRVAAQLVGCFHSDASAVTLHLMPRRDQPPSISGKLLPKWRLVTRLLGLVRGGRNSHEPTLPP